MLDAKQKVILVIGVIALIVFSSLKMLLNSGQSHNKRSDTQDMEHLISNEHEIQNEDAKLNNRLGQTYENYEKWEKATEEYSRALELEPRYLDARMGLGRALDALERRKEVIKLMEEGQDLFPENPLFPLSLGVHYRVLGELETANSYFDKALKISSPSMRHYIRQTIAEITAEQGNEKIGISTLFKPREKNVWAMLKEALSISLGNKKVFLAIVVFGILSFGWMLFLLPLAFIRNESFTTIFGCLASMIVPFVWVTAMVAIFLGATQGIILGQTDAYTFQFLSENFLRFWLAACLGQAILILVSFIPILGQFIGGRGAVVGPMVFTSLPVSMAINSGKEAFASFKLASTFVFDYFWLILLILILGGIISWLITIVVFGGVALVFSRTSSYPVSNIVEAICLPLTGIVVALGAAIPVIMMFLMCKDVLS